MTGKGLGSSTLLEEAIESWEFARRGVIAEAEVLGLESFGYRPHPRSMSVSELLMHLVKSGLMMVGELTDPAGDFTREVEGSFLEEHGGHLPDSPTPREVLELLDATFTEGVARLRTAGEVPMLQTIRRFDGKLWTRLAWMNHGVAHEEYHRGQLALYARLQGHVPALTRMIHGENAE